MPPTAGTFYSEHLGTLLRTRPPTHLNGGVNKGSYMTRWTSLLPLGGRAREVARVLMGPRI